MVSEGLFVFHVFETVFAYPQLGLLAIVLRERGEVPSINLKIADLYLIHILDFGDLRRDTW